MTTSPLLAPRILPELDESSRPYWTGGAAGELRIAHCGSCARFIHPPRDVCPECGSRLGYLAVSGEGTLFTFTIAHQQFHPDVPTPFVVALVELDEQRGLRVVTNIVDCDPASLASGMLVRVRFEQHDSLFVPVFAPAEPLT